MTFQLTSEMVHFLLSKRGARWLSRAEQFPLTPATRLSDLQTLRRDLSPEEAAAVVEQVLLRRKGRQKFDRADAMLFLRDALEQATPTPVARHRARRFQGRGLVADLGCGIGGDSLWLAQVADEVWSFELHPVRLIFAQYNASVYNLGHKIQCIHADALNLPARPIKFEAIFTDPARRTRGGKRIFRPQQYHPSLDKLMTTYVHRPMGIKVGPGLDFSTAPQAAEIEVTSLVGEVKEATLWFNDLATPGVSRRATLLPEGSTVTDDAVDTCPLGKLTNYLYEPDPAVIRAGLVKQVGALLNLHLLDEHVAYLSGPEALLSPFVKGYKIEARLPLKIKKINRYLKTHHISRVNVKQRGAGIDPEIFSRQLKPAGEGQEKTLILVRVQDEHLALVCQTLITGV